MSVKNIKKNAIRQLNLQNSHSIKNKFKRNLNDFSRTSLEINFIYITLKCYVIEEHELTTIITFLSINHNLSF